MADLEIAGKVLLVLKVRKVAKTVLFFGGAGNKRAVDIFGNLPGKSDCSYKRDQFPFQSKSE